MRGGHTLDQASLDPEFAYALMNSLGRHDARWNAQLKAPSSRGPCVAWTGDPVYP